MKRIRELFNLTTAEQRVVVIVLFLLLAFAMFQKQRERVAPRLSKESTSPATTPTAAETD